MNKCISCQKETNNPKFCSRSCSVTINNQVPKRPKRTFVNDCRLCGKPLRLKRSKYCCRYCQFNHKWLLKKQQFESSGVIFPKNTYHNSKSAKRYIEELKGNCCSICGQLPFWNNKPMILILDHINGIPDDWSIENLRLICSNCDTQLETYKSKNKNGGRPVKYKRKRHLDRDKHISYLDH